MNDDEYYRMIADHMENGFLENIVDMLKHDTALFGILPRLIQDERSRVRIGAVLIAEALRDTHAVHFRQVIEPIGKALLSHQEPFIRGDAAYLLGEIHLTEALSVLREALAQEEFEPVRQIIEESIADLSSL